MAFTLSRKESTRKRAKHNSITNVTNWNSNIIKLRKAEHRFGARGAIVNPLPEGEDLGEG